VHTFHTLTRFIFALILAQLLTLTVTK